MLQFARNFAHLCEMSLKYEQYFVQSSNISCNWARSFSGFTSAKKTKLFKGLKSWKCLKVGFSSAPLTQKLPLAKSGSQIDDLWPEKTNIESTAAPHAEPYQKVTIHILKKYSFKLTNSYQYKAPIGNELSCKNWVAKTDRTHLTLI